MYDLTDEDKEMMRGLFSINNDLYQLQESAKQDSTAAAVEHFGETAAADTPAEGIQGIMESVGEDIACSPLEAGEFSESELEGYAEIDTSEISEEMETEANSLYLKNEPENNRVSVIDPNNELEFSVQYTQPEPGNAAEGSFEAAMKETASSFFSAAISAVDVAIEWTSKAWNYYDSQLTKKLGLQADLTELEQDIDVMQGRLDRIKMKNPDIDWADCYEKGFFDAQQTSLNVLGEYRETKQTLSDMEKNLKNLRADLVSTKMNLENCQRVAGNTIFKYARTFRVLNSEAVAWGFAGLDIYSLISSIADAVEEFNDCIARNEGIQKVELQAKRWREDFGVACPTDQPKYEDQWEKCFDVYQELMNETAIAKDWNKQHLYVKYAQVVGELGSIAAGFVMKGPQGVFVGLGIGILGGASELLMLEKFHSALEEVNKLIPKVEMECVEPLADKSIADKDCGEPEGEGGGAGGSGGGGAGSGTGTEGNGTGEKPQYPVKTNPSIDPAGYVYEAVASNRIEGATAKIYYEGEDGEEVYWSEAEDYGEVNPQITGIDGRFAWMTPIGNWLVKVEKEGYKDADSKNDPAAVDGWLPVPPPQLDVNIAMTSTAAPTVLSSGAASDQIRVVFSQHMDIAQIKEGLVTVTQNGQPIFVDILFEDAEVSPTKDGVYYGRIMKLTRTDGAAFSGEGIVVTVAASAQNYAGTALGDVYTSGEMTVTQLVSSLSHSYPNRFVTDVGKTEQIAVQVLDTNGKPMSGATVTARQKVGGTLEMNESAVSDANGTAVFTAKGLSGGSDTILFSTDVVSTEMNTRVSPLGNKAPQKPTATLTDYAVVEKGTQLVLDCATEGAVIYYTTNNTCPCTDSAERKIYDGPVEITEDTFFRIAAWTEAGGYSERLNLHIRVKDTTPISFSWNDGTYTVTRKTFENGVSVLVASYEDGKMEKVEYLTAENPAATFTGDNVKVFFLDDETYAPIRKAMELQP